MSDKDDKHSGDNSGDGHKKTLSLKGAPSTGGRPGMSRSTRAVVVEKRTRRVATPGTNTPTPKPHLGGAPQRPKRPARPTGRPTPSRS